MDEAKYKPIPILGENQMPSQRPNKNLIENLIYDVKTDALCNLIEFEPFSKKRNENFSLQNAERLWSCNCSKMWFYEASTPGSGLNTNGCHIFPIFISKLKTKSALPAVK